MERERSKEKIPECCAGFHNVCHPDIFTKRSNITRLSPIIVTLGRRCNTAVDMKNLIEAGMNIARIRFSRISRDENVAMLKSLRQGIQLACEANVLSNWPIGIAIDIKSCVIRTGILSMEIPESTIILTEGAVIILSCDVATIHQCDYNQVFIGYPYLTKDIKIGGEVIIDRGQIVLICIEIIDELNIKCKVTVSGHLGSMNLVSLRGVKYSAPSLTQKDLDIIEFAKEENLDVLIVPYVRKVETLLEIKRHLGNKRKNIKILAQICTQECLDNLDDIIEESDAIILAREFMCFELLQDRTVLLQKQVSAICRKAGKPMFISGNLLDELKMHQAVTGGMTADITNTVLDGVDGFLVKDVSIHITEMLVMLVSLSNICKATETLLFDTNGFWRLLCKDEVPANAAKACIASCVLTAHCCGAAAVVVLTSSGNTAQAVASLRPACPVLAVTKHEKVARTMHMYRGVVPILISNSAEDFRRVTWDKERDRSVDYAVEFAVTRGMVEYGQTLVMMFKSQGYSTFCDTIQIVEVSAVKKVPWRCDDP